MKYTVFGKTIIQLIVILFLSIILNYESKAQNTLSTLSGVIVDMDGEPVANLTLAMKPVEFKSGRRSAPRAPGTTWQKAITNKDGEFAIKNIQPNRFQLVVYPELGSGIGISSIRIGNVIVQSTAFRAQAPTWYGKPTISIEPGSHLRNVVVRVRKPGMSISGRVLLEDGTPLANTEVYLTTLRRNRKTRYLFFSSGGSSGRTSRDVITDAEGYFITYTPDKPVEYAVVVKYQGISARSRWYRLKSGQSKENLILKLSGLEKEQFKQAERAKARKAMWIVNPSNNHAYKIIECESWNDALAKAKTENAYLVEFMDEAERKWVESVFRERKFYWIGLSVPSKGKPWQWFSGKPLTHTNWGPSGRPDNKSIDSDVVPVTLIFSTKKWLALDNTNPIRPMVKHAILEKNEY